MNLAGKNILVTGSCGLVGTNALLALKDMPQIKVRAVDFGKEPSVFADNITHLEADLTDFDQCKRVVEGIDYCLMFAMKIARRSTNLEYIITNLKMNSQMLEAAHQAQVKKYLWLSSSVAYPEKSSPLTEEEMFLSDPADSYFPVAQMTRYIEILCRMYATKVKNPMTTIVLRPTAIYGEHCDFNPKTSHVLPALIRKVVERQSPIEVWGKGKVKRDFVYVSDVVRACLLALSKIDKFTEFNIGLEKSCSTKELLDVILKLDDFSDAEVAFDETKGGNLHSIFVDCGKAKELLGWQAKVTLEEGLKKTIEWFKKEYSKDNLAQDSKRCLK